MTNRVCQRASHPNRCFFHFLLLLALLGAASARAGLTFTVDLYTTQGYYVFYTPLNTNSVGAPASQGAYTIYSPTQPTNGSWREMVYDNTGMYTVSGSEHYYTNLALALQNITNGEWSLQYSDGTNTSNYYFTVSLPDGLSSNQIPVTYITSPVPNQIINGRPNITWTGGPADWPVTGTVYLYKTENYDYYYPDPNPLSPTANNWDVPLFIPPDEPGGQTVANVDYTTNYANTLFVATTPEDTNSRAISGWITSTILETGGNVPFTIVPPPAASTNHILIAHYAFDNDDLGYDSSTNGYDLECGSGWGSNEYQQFTTNAVAGGGAIQFFGDSSITPCGDPVFSVFTNVYAGSFTLSTWVKTSTVVGNNTDSLDDGNGQTVIYLNNNYDGLIPLGITGSRAAFETSLPDGEYGDTDTLHSSNSVTTGEYVNVVVTRDGGSGLKQIYVNGALNSSDYGVAGPLASADYASIGGELFGPYVGELDDVQIYSGVLTPSEIAALYSAPGTTIPDGSTPTFGSSLGTTNLSWSTSGDTAWFLESTNTANGDAMAAESGIATNYQTSTLTLTVNGPANLTFYWAAQAINPYNFDYEVYLDGDPYNNYLDDLYYNSGWYQDGPFAIPGGQHTVSWTVYPNGDNDPTEAGFLDQVSVTPITVPISNPVVTNGLFQFTFTPEQGIQYDVVSTLDLSSGQWFTNETITGYNYPYQVSIPYTTNLTQEFFSIWPR
jgi:hypothetical protein